MPGAQSMVALSEGGGAIVGAALVIGLVAWGLGLVLTAAALHVLGGQQRPVGVWRAIRLVGLSRLWAFLRIALLSGLTIGATAVVAGLLRDLVVAWGDTAGWSGQTLMVSVPALAALPVLAAMALCGAWAHWVRVAVVADDLPVRRALIVSARGMLLRPGLMIVFPVSVGLAVQLGGVVVLMTWAQLPATGSATAAGFAAWILLGLVQAFTWHWLQHSGRLTWALPDMRRISA